MAAVRGSAERAATAVRRGARAVRAARADWLLGAGLLIGWLFLTAGIAHLTAPVAWLLSFGVFVLSLCGWRLIGTVAWEGLYKLTRDDASQRTRDGAHG